MKYGFSCCCSRCTALPPTYVDRVLQVRTLLNNIPFVYLFRILMFQRKPRAVLVQEIEFVTLILDFLGWDLGSVIICWLSSTTESTIRKPCIYAIFIAP